MPTYRERRLVLFLHAWNQKPEQLLELVQLVRNKLSDCDIDLPRLPLPWGAFVDLAELSNALADRLDDHWARHIERNGVPYEEIFIVGHSAGATLARTLFLTGLGTNLSKDGLLTGKPRAWNKAVKRIIQFAAFNRGWEVSYLAQGRWAIIFALGRWLSLLARPLCGNHIGLQIYRGSRFINEMRLRWLHFEQVAEQTGMSWPLVIQMLGSSDTLIAPDDSVDLNTGRHFVYLDVPFTDHYNIVDLYTGTDAQILAQRRERFVSAFCDLAELLRRKSELEIQTGANPNVRDVVFVIHGIRDPGFWAQHIGRTVRDKAEQAGRKHEFKILTPSYGFFAMGPFLLKGLRHKKVTWFMEHYIEARALYPNARISYIGHSHGTYLATRALELYPSCQFFRLAFAGSVVRSVFPWLNYLRRRSGVRRVDAVCNFVATRDFVVAGFPRLFEVLPVTDLGAAGHRGFVARCAGKVGNFRYAAGGHSAALREPFWPSLAKFMVTGEMPKESASHPKNQCWLARGLGAFPFIAWAGAAVGAGILLWAAIAIASRLGMLFPNYQSHFIGVSWILWLWIMLIILRRV